MLSDIRILRLHLLHVRELDALGLAEPPVGRDEQHALLAIDRDRVRGSSRHDEIGDQRHQEETGDS